LQAKQAMVRSARKLLRGGVYEKEKASKKKERPALKAGSLGKENKARSDISKKTTGEEMRRWKELLQAGKSGGSREGRKKRKRAR